MAERSEPHETLCFVWNTAKPSTNSSCRSRDFTLMGTKCYLLLESSKNPFFRGYNYRISMHLETEELKLPFHIVTFIVNTLQGEDLQTLYPLMNMKHVLSVKKPVIWAYPESVVSEAIKDDTAWRVVCVFYNDPPNAFESKKDTINVLGEADTSSSNTAEKGIQACIEIPPDMQRLSDDFSNLLTKEIFPDMKLNCAGQTRSGHRSILAARSEVFTAMFRNKMAESETGSVDIKDMDVPILDMLLHYVYAGKLPDLMDDTAVQLYEAGDKYAMSTLKKACSDWMVRNMSEENCVSFLNVADAHSDDEFKESVVTFIFDHPTVFECDAWVKFSKENVKLAYEVIKEAYSRKK